MLDRRTAPIIQPIFNFCPLEAQKSKLSNGIPIVSLHNPDLQLIRLDIRLSAGSIYQSKPATALATAKLLTEGTILLTAEEIAEKIDYAGAYFEDVPERDFVTFSIYFPKDVADDILPLISQIFRMPIFPKEKLQLFVNKQKRQLAINLEKTSYLACARLMEYIFGPLHPYAMSLKMDSLDNLCQDDLVEFHRKNYHAGNMRIFAAGSIDADFLVLLEEAFGFIEVGKSNDGLSYPLLGTNAPQIILKENAVQSSVCIGRELFTCHDKRWIPMLILNTVLGGYFGSRLMSNIREDKGLTYGIYSRIYSFLHGGYFMIRADVNRELLSQAIEEIHVELKRLRNEPIPDSELELVKNYLYGTLLRDFDGVFSQIERTIFCNDFRFPDNYWTQYLNIINKTTPSDLLELAKIYLDEKEMFEIVAGEDAKTL